MRMPFAKLLLASVPAPLQAMLLILLMNGFGAGCGDDDTSNPTTPPADGGVDMVAPDGAMGDAIELPGLNGEVEVIIDDRGMPHIYATTRHDLMVVQGFLMSRDRFVQMEFIRRGVTGELADVLALADPSVVNSDRGSRFLGFKRQGQAIYDSLPTADPARLAADAFVEGVNLYIDEVIKQPDYEPPPALAVFNFIRGNDTFGHWTGADIFALARFQAWNLSYDADADIARTRRRVAAEAAFDPAAEDEALRSRAGAFSDFFSDRQARRVYTREGFPPATLSLEGVGRAGSRNLPHMLERADQFFMRLRSHPLLRRDEHVGSNSWVVHGDHTASGFSILANDPHLSLTSPGVWWYVHLNTEKMGGEDAIDVEGVAFAGLPGVVLGYSRNLAWGATTAAYDVTDVYAEEVVFRNDGAEAAPQWTPVSVRFQGEEVALEIIDEVIAVDEADPVTLSIWNVPHHGPIVPDSLVEPTAAVATGETADGSALSIRYTGHQPSNELAFFVRLMTATTVEEAFAAQQIFEVGAQNISVVARDGDIGWSSHAWIPQRSAAACSFALDDQGVIQGTSPLFVLPGTGEYEWTEDLDDALVPRDINPDKGFIATANQDNVGVTDDGNICNDAGYLGGAFAVGYRMYRIDERLRAAVAEGDITPADMIALQAETKSSLGETMRDPLVASLDVALSGGEGDPALMTYMASLDDGGRRQLQAARDALVGWSLQTPDGVGETETELVADSVATTVFNATLTRLMNLAFLDEWNRMTGGPGASQSARMLEWALADATAQQSLPLYTFRTAYAGIGNWNDTVLWDDLDTPGVVESRDERVARAVTAAFEWLTDTLGEDMQQWRWGRLHAVRFDQIAPSLTGRNEISIPPGDSAEFPIGFPRHGDFGAVDVGNFSLTNGEDFTFGSGASQRLVVEMTAEGPRAFNALPGGQSEHLDSPHHADEAELWRRNAQPAMYFEQSDVDAHMESRLSFAPR